MNENIFFQLLSLTKNLSSAFYKIEDLKLRSLSLIAKNRGKLMVLLFSSVVISLFRESVRAAFGLEMNLKTQFVVLWLLVIYLFKLSGYVSVSLATLFMFLGAIFLSFGAVVIADEISNLAYLLLVIGLLQQLVGLSCCGRSE